MTFEDWLEKVDYYFIMITGLDRDTWPDQDYWDMWDAGMVPAEALMAAIENECGKTGLEFFNLMAFV